MERFLMCSPDYFGVEYEINVHMKMDNKVNQLRASQQWDTLVYLLNQIGAHIHFMRPKQGCPDLVFTANAGLAHGNRIALANFAAKERQPEQPHFAKFFKDCTKMEPLTFPKDVAFEGAGDSFIHNQALYLGTGFRSTAAALPYLDDFFKPSKFLVCRLVDPRFYHLDTAFCPLDEETVMYYPGAFDEDTQQSLSLEPWDKIIVPEEEAALFACNAVVAGRHVILPSGCPQTKEMLDKHGFVPHEVDMGEFLKAGGACKCLTLAF